MPLLETVKLLGIALAVILFLKFLLPLAIPFLLAFLLAKWLHPLIEKLQKRLPIKAGLLSGLVLLLLLAVLSVVVWLLLRAALGQLRQLTDSFPTFWEKACELGHSCCVQVERWTGYRAELLEAKIETTVPRMWESMRETVLPSMVNRSLSWLKGIGTAAGIGLVTVVSGVLILTEYDKIRQGLTEHTLGRLALGVARRVYHAGGGYLKAQLLILLAVTAVCVAGLFCTGNSYPLLAGLGIGICDAMPFLGTGTILIPWALLKLFQGNYLLAAAYAGIYAIATLTREMLEPRLVGDKLGISPLAVVASLYVGLCIFGLWGFALGPGGYILIKEIWREISPAGREPGT